MKKRISTAIVILVICSIFLYAKNAGEGYTAEEMEVQEDIDRIGQCRHLKKLTIHIWNGELDLSPLSNLTELKELSFFDVNLKDYSFFIPCSN